VRASAFDILKPPEPGSVLTVRYNGFWKNSNKFKYPVLVRIRSELE
jgi:hypothetical protein